jgi:hypothetical protein
MQNDSRGGGFLFQNFSVGGDGNHLPRNKFAACHQGAFGSVFDSAAAGNLHADNGYAFDVVIGNDLRQLIGVIALVKLGTTDKRYVTPDKLIVKVSVSISGTVCRNKKICSVKVGCINGYKLNLYGPLSELTAYGCRSSTAVTSVTVNCL